MFLPISCKEKDSVAIEAADWQKVLNLVRSMGFYIDRHDSSTGKLEIRIPQVRKVAPDKKGEQDT